MRLHIVILPPKSSRNKLGRIGAKLSKEHKLIFGVDNKKLLSHITIFGLRAQKNKLPKILKSVQEIAKSNNPFRLELKGTGGLYGYFDFGVVKNPPLYKLHKEIVMAVSVFRDKSAVRGELKGLQAKYYKQYGARFILSLFRPHITVGRTMNSSEQKKIKQNLVAPERYFVANGIAVTQIDSQSQVTKVLGEFKFKLK